MSSTTRVDSTPRWMRWTGWVFSFFPVLILLSSAWVRSTHHTAAVAEIVTGYGFPESFIGFIVVAECVLVALYLIPQTSVLGAIVMTSYLGGAVAAHLRVGDGARSAIPVFAAILAWGGLYLRDRRVRELVPFRGRQP